MIGYGSFMQLKDISKSYLFATALALFVHCFQYIPIPNYLILSIQLVVIAVVLLLFFRYVDTEEVREIKDMLEVYLGKFKLQRKYNGK